MLNVILTSESPLKIEAVENALEISFRNDFTLTSINTDQVKKPPQPLNDGILTSACKRIIAIDPPSDDCMIISIENGIIVNDDSTVSDVCVVIASCQNGFQASHQSFGIDVPWKYYHEAVMSTPDDYELGHLGLLVTAGEMIHKEFPDVDPKNWMAHDQFGGVHRVDQIMDPLFKCLYDYKKYVIGKNVLHFNDFPKKGVVFKDLSRILQDRVLLTHLTDYMVHRVRSEFRETIIDKVVGLDARGFLIGPLLALGVGAGFVMARKKRETSGQR